MNKKLLLASVAIAGVLFGGAAHADDAWCGQPTVFLGDTYDSDPVMNVRVQYNPDFHTWNILLYSGGGRIVSRAQQYAITDYSNDFHSKWGGSLNRNRNLYMVGELHENGVYEEWLYDRSHGNRLDMHWAVQCRVSVPEPVRAPPVAVRPVPVPVPIPVPVAPAAPVQQTAPVQQNGPVVVTPTPNNNITITVVPGTTYSPVPKGEEKKPEEKGS